MSTSIELHLDSGSEVFDISEPPRFCSLPLKWACAKRYAIMDCRQVLQQSLKHYIGLIEVFEDADNHQILVDYQITRPSFLMVATIQGAYLTFKPTGSYVEQPFQKNNKGLILVFDQQWLSYKFAQLPDMEHFIGNFADPTNSAFTMPIFNIGSSIFRNLIKMDHHANYLSLDADTPILLSTIASTPITSS